MISIRDFSAGFVVGFGSGVAFRSLADNDFASVKDIMKTGVGIAQKVGDAMADGFGRLKESVEDIRETVRAERVKERVDKAVDKVARKATAKTRGRSTVARGRQRRRSSARRAVGYNA